jgi:hypothetical protein
MVSEDFIVLVEDWCTRRIRRLSKLLRVAGGFNVEFRESKFHQLRWSFISRP